MLPLSVISYLDERLGPYRTGISTAFAIHSLAGFLWDFYRGR